MSLSIRLFLLFFYLIPTVSLSSECPIGQHWVKTHKRRAYFRATGDFVKATKVIAHCRNNRTSDTYWQNKFENIGPNEWPHKDEKSKTWEFEEIERVLDAICELPEEIWKKSQLKIFRMAKSKDGLNPATSAEGILVLYDSAFSQKTILSRILAHEFAHEIYNRLNESDAKDYRFVTNWYEFNKDGLRRLISRKDGFVTDDGRVSPEEDFSNNLEFFLFEDKNLKSKTPHAYRWFERYFNDKLRLRKCEK